MEENVCSRQFGERACCLPGPTNIRGQLTYLYNLKIKKKTQAGKNKTPSHLDEQYLNSRILSTTWKAQEYTPAKQDTN